MDLRPRLHTGLLTDHLRIERQMVFAPGPRHPRFDAVEHPVEAQIRG